MGATGAELRDQFDIYQGATQLGFDKIYESGCTATLPSSPEEDQEAKWMTL